MAFTSLFSKLCGVDEAVRRPDPSDLTSRNRNEDNSRGRKRKSHQPASNRKKRRYECQTSDSLKFNDFQDRSTKCSRSPAGRAEETRNNHQYKPDYNSRQNSKNKQNCNVRKQEQHPRRGRGRFSQKRDERNSKSTEQVKPKYMTQEFKDQNALLVDGRLLCRHFLHGRCIKEDKCQLEHIQGYNDLLKEPCKFYVQGFCLKGDGCPFMHQSFPCKFFHRRGKCLQEANCRFSHDPLNEVTEKLLDKVLKIEKDQRELRKEAEQRSSEQSANKDEPENTETNENPEILSQILRPNFYNSAEAEKETDPGQTDERVSEAAEPHSSVSTSPNQQDPVCYSVEVVLGPQLFRPLSSFSKTPGSEEPPDASSSQSSSDAALASPNQSEVPYSVHTVLQSCKNFTFGPTPSPLPAQTGSYVPQFFTKEIPDPLWSSQNQHEKLSQNIGHVANTSQERKSFLSLQDQTSSDPSLTSQEPKKQHAASSQCQKTAEGTSHEGELKLLNPHVAEAEKSVSSRTNRDDEESMKPLAGTMRSETSTGDPDLPEPPAELQLNLSALTSQSLTTSPSSNIREFKETGAAAVQTSSVNTRNPKHVAVHRFAARQLTQILQNPKKNPFTLKRVTVDHRSSEISSRSRSKTSDQGGFSSGFSRTSDQGGFSSRFSKTQRRQFSHLFANPLSASDSVTADPTCSEAFIKSPPSAEVQTKTSSFTSLFAAPLRETPASFSSLQAQTSRPCSQQPAESNPSPRPGLETASSRLQTDDRQTSSPEPGNHPVEQQVSPESECPGDPPAGQTEQQLMDVLSSRGNPANSILKTLFLRLEPFQEDEEPQDRSSVPSRSRMKKGCSEDVTLKQQLKNPQNNKKKNLRIRTRLAVPPFIHTGAQIKN